jgi:hypothetical protein
MWIGEGGDYGFKKSDPFLLSVFKRELILQLTPTTKDEGSAGKERNQGDYRRSDIWRTSPFQQLHF